MRLSRIKNYEHNCHYFWSWVCIKIFNSKLNLYSTNKLPIHILWLSGIYGPHRNCLEQIKNGQDFTIVKKDQFFSEFMSKIFAWLLLLP